MSRTGCCLGVLLMMLGMGLLFLIIVIPSLPGAENNGTIMNALEPLLCKSGETLTQDTSVYSDPRGTIRSPHYYCGTSEDTRREVPKKATTYGAVGFVAPLVIGLLLTIFGSIGMASHAARSVLKLPNVLESATGGSGAYQTNPDGSITVNASGVPIHIATTGRTAFAEMPGSSPTTAAQKLQQLEDLRTKQLISQEEYDRLRGEILDESF